MRATRFTVRDIETGKPYTWRVLKEGAYWFLYDHADYPRTLEKNWTDSLPKIRLICENHGVTCDLS